MKTKNVNLDDVVFEERNKNYGAFLLRKSYNKNVAIALFLALLFFFFVIAYPLLAGLTDNISSKIETKVDCNFTELSEPPEKQEIQLPELPEPLPVERYTVPILVDSAVIDDDGGLADLMYNTQNGTPPDIGDGGIIVVKEPEKNSPIEPISNNEVFLNVQEMPEFIGGIEKMHEYLSKNIVYPQIAKDNGIKGKVHVKFVVEKDGSISNVTLLNDIGGGCGEEALRVINSMPKWRPGKQNSTTVRVWFVLPIHFDLIEK